MRVGVCLSLTILFCGGLTGPPFLLGCVMTRYGEATAWSYRAALPSSGPAASDAELQGQHRPRTTYLPLDPLCRCLGSMASPGPAKCSGEGSSS